MISDAQLKSNISLQKHYTIGIVQAIFELLELLFRESSNKEEKNRIEDVMESLDKYDKLMRSKVYGKVKK